MTNTFVPEWIHGCGPEADIVISSRARLARCIDGYPFPFKASESDLIEVADRVVSASRQIDEFKLIPIDKISAIARNSLVDAYIISPEFTQGGPGRIVLLDSRQKLSIMVNEEDHLRIQLMDSGLTISNIWDNINSFDDQLAQHLSFGFSEKIGFLTSSISNLGTGLRLSVMMHLASLVHNGSLAGHIKAANELGVSVRGLHGEGSRPLGDLFQVSNEHTLGMPEVELVDKVNSVAMYLLEAERKARKEFVETKKNTMMEILADALRNLQHSHNISAEKALSSLSLVRLGFETGFVRGCSRENLNLLLTKMMSMYDKDFEAGITRVEVLRKYLKNAEMNL